MTPRQTYRNLPMRGSFEAVIRMATRGLVVSEQKTPLGIQLADGDRQVQAGEWALLTLLLSRSAGSSGAAQIKFVSCSDKDVQLDTDLLQADVEVRPGEVYRLTLPLRVACPKTVDLSTIALQVGISGELDVLVPLPQRLLPTNPAISHEVQVTLESLCAYSQGTKTELVLSHEGATRFDNFRITLGPESAIAAGKRVIHRATFSPGDREQLEVVIAGDHLEVTLSAEIEGRRISAGFRRPVPRVAARLERRFRFLEPRRLSLDQKSITEDGSGRPVEPVHAAYPLNGEQRYKIVIRPQLPDVVEVKLHDIPGVAYVLKTEAEIGNRAWVFLLDVSGKGRFSKPERLFYDVVTPRESLTGEIHVCLKPPRFTYVTLAATLGLALTVQGFGALARFLLKPDFSLEDALGHFQMASDYQLLFALSIPFGWGTLTLYDWLQYRLRD